MHVIKLREASENDFEAMAAVQQLAVDVTLREFYDNSAIDKWLTQIDAAKFRRVAAQGDLSSVAEYDGELVGFASVNPTNSLLSMWYVSPLHHGKGVGKALIEQSLATLKLYGSTEVSTESSAHARPRFESLGWQVVEEYDKPAFGAKMRVTKMMFIF